MPPLHHICDERSVVLYVGYIPEQHTPVIPVCFWLCSSARPPDQLSLSVYQYERRRLHERKQLHTVQRIRGTVYTQSKGESYREENSLFSSARQVDMDILPGSCLRAYCDSSYSVKRRRVHTAKKESVIWAGQH